MSADQITALKGKLDIDASGIDAAGDTDDPSDYAIVIRNPSSTNQGNGIAFTNDSGQHVGGAIIHIDKGSNNLGDLAFYTAATSSTPLERLRIKSDGQIFVGSDSDDFSDIGTFFNIKNNTYGGRIGFSNSTATANVTLMEQFAYWGTNKVAGMISLAGTDSTNKTDGVLKFYTCPSGGTLTERLSLGSTGVVHINSNTNNHTVIAHGNPSDTTGFEQQNRVGGTTVLVQDESISSAIYMPRQGCLVAITAFSSVDNSEYPQPNTSGMVYIDCGPSRNIQIFDLGTAVGTGLVAKAAYTSVVADCDNGKTTIMAGDTQGTFRIVNRESNNAYRYQITFL